MSDCYPAEGFLNVYPVKLRNDAYCKELQRIIDEYGPTLWVHSFRLIWQDDEPEDIVWRGISFAGVVYLLNRACRLAQLKVRFRCPIVMGALGEYPYKKNECELPLNYVPPPLPPKAGAIDPRERYAKPERIAPKSDHRYVAYKRPYHK